MSGATTSFWKLLEESRLLSAEQVQQLAAGYGQSGGSSNGADAKGVADWLVSRNVVSKYQATVLLAGHSGPFLYAEYSVYDRIEKGRLAGCFRAVHRPTSHPVLLQFLSGPVVSDAAQWARAAQLALAACTIRSPYVQRYFEPVDLGAFKFLVGEDLRGKSLEDRRQQNPVSAPEACRVVRLAALGLAQMHVAGRVHGDVRPANLWLEKAAGSHPENVKLLYEPHALPGPLPLADVDPAGHLSLLADYAAPELAQPGMTPSPVTDIYSLGCTLYTLLAGRPPFAGGSPQQKFVRHATEPIQPLEQFGVPQPLAQLVAFLMAKNPSLRFQAAAQVAEQLTPFVDSQAAFVPPPSPAATAAAYESWVMQKLTQLTAPAAAPQPVPQAAIGPGPALDVNVVAERKAPAGISSSAAKGATAAAAYQKIRRRRQIQLVAGMAVVAIGILAGGVYLFNWLRSKPAPTEEVVISHKSDRDSTQKASGEKQPVKPEGTADGRDRKDSKAVSGSESGLEIVENDDTLLWAPPTSGPAVELRLVPPEGQVFVIARPADILASPEGPKVLEALGPDFAARRAAWEVAAGISLDQVEQLIVGLHNNDGQFPRTSFVVRTKEPIPSDQWRAKWGQPQEQKEGTTTWYAGKDWAYYLSTNESDKGAFLMAAPADVQEVVKAGGAPPPLLRDVERLRRWTDEQRHLTVLFYPAFLFNDDGQPLFAGERSKIRDPLAWFLGEGLQAAQVSVHLADPFYFEMRMLGSLDKEKYELASEFRDRLKAVPAGLEDYMDRLTPPPYWSKLARRYPLMVTELHKNMRIGVENDQAVVNAYLEGPAAHSLVLGGELLIASAPGAAIAAAGPAEPDGPKNIDEVLALKTSMSFAAQSLEFAMRDIADDVRANLLRGAPVEFEIKLIGKDMEKDGITRNQTINDFKQENATVADVLTAMVMKANAPSVPDPSLPGQKLIWVVAPDPDKPSRQIILITTRTAAEREKYKLPAPFQPKS